MSEPAGRRSDGVSMLGVGLGVVVTLLVVAVVLLVLVLRRDASPSTPTAAPPPASPTPGPTPSPTPDGDFRALYREVYDGVVRLEVVTCSGAGTGSGALVADDLVVTAAHVVEDAQSVQLLVGDTSAAGEVVGLSPGEDLALVRASRPFPGHVFTLSPSVPEVGTEVAALGFPLSGPLSLAGPGIVSTHDETVSYVTGDPPEEVVVDGLMRVTLPTNAGNSGGPVVDGAGDVVGLVSGSRTSSGTVDEFGTVIVDTIEGIKYAVPGDRVADRVAEWSADPDPAPPAECEGEPPLDAGDRDLVTALVDGPEVPAVLDVLTDYAEGINLSDYDRAYAQLSPGRRSVLSRAEFEEQQSTSVLTDLVVLDVTGDGAGDDGALRARTAFTSYQAPELGPGGHDCVFWDLEFVLVPGGEHGWVIDEADGVGDPPWEACSS